MLFCGAFFCGALFCGVASGPALAQAPSAEEQLGSIRDELRKANVPAFVLADAFS